MRCRPVGAVVLRHHDLKQLGRQGQRELANAVGLGLTLLCRKQWRQHVKQAQGSRRRAAGGWLERNSNALDARVKRLALTKDEQQHAKRMLQIQAEVVGVMATALTEAQRPGLVQTMGNVSKALRGFRQPR